MGWSLGWRGGSGGRNDSRQRGAGGATRGGRAHQVRLLDREQAIPGADPAAVRELAPLAPAGAGNQQLLDPLAAGLVVEILLLDRTRPRNVVCVGRVAGRERRARAADVGARDVDDLLRQLDQVGLLAEGVWKGGDRVSAARYARAGLPPRSNVDALV